MLLISRHLQEGGVWGGGVPFPNGGGVWEVLKTTEGLDNTGNNSEGGSWS